MRRKNLMTALLCAAVVAASTVMAPGVVMAEETEAVTRGIHRGGDGSRYRSVDRGIHRRGTGARRASGL